ncbi:MBL fold metallo-hydrolase [Fodinibius salsisoli]|uniref:MBL fold metallo-hydrolase n=1 Tax=Fodinibius salsisoli TaxID=2820877 RepID=A0ABT3PPT0_9BACT|nr:MBL fold metallo-hydrolase [Fodinibius salsisoli]MCW9707867.1 MBL fold metallo-hydrolase [Fodinibius salsisoli]
MKIHHIRNATMIIETAGKVLLVDPMLGSKGNLPPLTLFRFKPRKNPMVPLPNNMDRLLEKVTHCLITHQHPDHLDQQGIQFLKDRQIPILCSTKDEQDLTDEGLNVQTSLNYWETTDFAGLRVTGTPALHGYGFITKLMGNVIGFYLEPPEEPSIYLSSDTIYTEAVHKVLTEFQPDISVAACGSAQFDIFGPLLMTMDDILKFFNHAPGKVIANHLEAINHCPTTRAELQKKVANNDLEKKVWIPEDGETIDLST